MARKKHSSYLSNGTSIHGIDIRLIKQANIAKVIGLLEETQRNKDWVIDKIKDRRKSHPLSGIDLRTASVYRILEACPPGLVFELVNLLKSGEFIEFDKISLTTKTYHWFFTDIVASSKEEIATKDQARKIIVLNNLIAMTKSFQKKTPDCKILPTGDGVAIGFTDSAESPLTLAMDLHALLQKYNESRTEKEKVRIRIGLDTGPVYHFRDLNKNENVWGPGIIMARRVMDLANPMNILATDNYANAVKNLKEEYRKFFVELRDYGTKHKRVQLYNVVGEGFGSRKTPSDPSKLEQVGGIPVKYVYNRIQVILDVLDNKSWLTHHTLAWDFTNVSKASLGNLSYVIWGDQERSFRNLNLLVRDAHGREQELLSMDSNEPYKKQFVFKLNKTVEPGKLGFARIEYDWEESKRTYGYDFASQCKEFKISVLLPKEVEISQKILRKNIHTGEKTYWGSAKVQYRNPKTQLTWSAVNIPAHDAYEIRW